MNPLELAVTLCGPALVAGALWAAWRVRRWWRESDRPAVRIDIALADGHVLTWTAEAVVEAVVETVVE